MKSGFALLVLFCCVLAPHACLAQAVGNNVSGVVLDPSGATIAGAQVELKRADSEAIASAVTNNAGGFHFDGMSAGQYHIVVQATGFKDSGQDVNIGSKPISLKIVLAVAAEAETIEVGPNAGSSQVSTEIAENQNANVLDRSALDHMPVFDQDYIATVSRFLDDNAIGTNGVTLVVNGLESNGPGVTASAIQEVKINQNPYSALFSRPGRARMEITTKGGTPQFHGTLTFMFRDSVVDAANAFAGVKPPEQRRYFEGSLTGPLGKSKKTTFLLSLNQDYLDLQNIVVAQGLSGPINENVPNPTRHFFGSGRIFHDFTPHDQFWIGYSYERKTVQNAGVGGTVMPEAGTDTKSQEHEVNVSYRHTFSGTTVNQLRFLLGHHDLPTTSINPEPAIVVQGAFTGGGAQANFRRTEYHLEGTDIVTRVVGKHELNFGVDVPDLSRRAFDDFTNTQGTYTFASLAAYQAGLPTTYLVQRGQGHVAFMELNFAGFVEDKIRLRPDLAISVGLRYYWQNYFNDRATNFAPRLGFAYAPSKNRKIVLRGGAGIFYDRTGPWPIADLLHFNGVNLLQYIVENPSFPVAPASLAAAPTSLMELDPRTRIPYTLQYSASIERQMTAKSTATIAYVGSRGMDMFRSIDANAPLPPNFATIPNPALGQVSEMQSEGYQKSNALELTFQGAPSKYFTGQVQYRLSKTYNNTGGIWWYPQNSYDPSADWARAGNDRRHKFDMMGSLHPTRFFNLGMALSLYSGLPVDVTTGSDNNLDGILNDRPAGVPRNSMHGPGQISLDFSLSHDFLLSKARDHAKTLSAALNAFNILNHTNDMTYVGVITSPFFGHAVTALPPRRMQLDLVYKF